MDGPLQSTPVPCVTKTYSITAGLTDLAIPYSRPAKTCQESSRPIGGGLAAPIRVSQCVVMRLPASGLPSPPLGGSASATLVHPAAPEHAPAPSPAPDRSSGRAGCPDRRGYSGYLHQVLAVFLRDQHGLDAAAVGGEQLFLKSTDRQHLAAQRDLAGHGDIGAHRYLGQRRYHGGAHGDTRARAVLGRGALRHMHVKIVLLVKSCGMPSAVARAPRSWPPE